MTLNQLKKLILAAKQAGGSLLNLSAARHRRVLSALADLLWQSQRSIIEANRRDIKAAKLSGQGASFVERLSLDSKRIQVMVESVRTIANQRDHLFEELAKFRRPSGLRIRKVRYPLGLIAMIYESRPNVTVDAFALAFKSGNALLLRGGKEIKFTNQALVRLIHRALVREGISRDAVIDLSELDRNLSRELCRNSLIDCLIPRGGKGLIDYVRREARVPVIITGASVVHTYVDSSADLKTAAKVIMNAKTRRVSICNALDVVLVHRTVAKSLLKLLAPELARKNVELRADKESYQILNQLGYARLKLAKAKDFDTEFLDYILSTKVVGGFEEAMVHITKHSLGHSEAIITKSRKQADEFFRQIDAACLYVNTSTQFGDGGEFGMGGEIGISTQKLHARGPFATEGLTTYKYLVESDGATRG